ncbi:uncharacterized protein LOC125498188 [Beta vulgaris subsp. vulgaris]|uniref:uncharacterized protein LOC125498188 n=1 Tax=Beta vulgaris subsp. vulgaris TaxID=3555 RepID=UPI00254830D5|nr:uncharacterized protein LOC125498188 [Beta vulgaris subsp. vulgaris]
MGLLRCMSIRSIDLDPPPIQLTFIEEKGVTICQQSSLGEWIPVKFLVLLLSLVHELEIVQLSTDNYFKAELKAGSKAELNALVHTICHVAEKFANVLLIILDKLISYSESSCSIFWSHAAVDTRLPGSVTGKLGGPSRRRLSSPVTALVLQAVFSLCFCTLFIC